MDDDVQAKRVILYDGAGPRRKPARVGRSWVWISGRVLKGNGQTVDFPAFDLYRVKDGRIAGNRHLEDNLTLLRQLGAIKP
jgi:hypothetical protein